MKILILGGTSFLGPALIEALLDGGHVPTLFNRGKTQSNQAIQLTVERIIGDRANSGDLNRLAGGRWDAVIDTCGYFPDDVSQSAQLLSSRCGHYVFISTVSVYDEQINGPTTEQSPVAKLPPDAQIEQRDGRFYGACKALCEQAVECAMPGRVSNIRPGLIIGPGDPSGRFSYWPWRLSRGGEVLCPGPAEQLVQFIDVRDLAAWVVNAVIEAQLFGTFNATGPDTPMTMDEFIKRCRAGVAGDAVLHWVDAEFLLAQKVQPYVEMPLWTAGQNQYAQRSTAKAQAAGLRCRPVEESARDTLAWLNARQTTAKAPGAGLSWEREIALLKSSRAQ